MRDTLRSLSLLTLVITLLAKVAPGSAETPPLPAFSRDTVLVWHMQFSEGSAEFVVRLADFLPDRFLEWENSTTQGTIFMPNKAIVNAKGFADARLFEGGVDTKGSDTTTLWISQRIYRELKSKGKAKILLDSIDGWLVVAGAAQMTIEVNRSPMVLPVVKVKDERGSERWFLDFEENPLLAKHTVRNYCQTLTSITTDKPNTLRWIKGKKLTSPH